MAKPKIVILCVDDEEIPLTLRRLVLEKAGYEVIACNLVADGLDILKSRRVDLVLSDHLMPGATGTEFARLIKASHPTLPVIVYSGVNEIPPDAAAADQFLSKLEGPESLCEKITLELAKWGKVAPERS